MGNKASAFHESEGSRTLLHTFTCNKKGAKVMAKQKTAKRIIQAHLFKITAQLLLSLQNVEFKGKGVIRGMTHFKPEMSVFKIS